MNVSINGLQASLFASSNKLNKFLQQSNPDEMYQLKINDAYRLQEIVNELTNDIVMACAIIDPETGKSFLDDETVKVEHLDYDLD